MHLKTNAFWVVSGGSHCEPVLWWSEVASLSNCFYFWTYVAGQFYVCYRCCLIAKIIVSCQLSIFILLQPDLLSNVVDFRKHQMIGMLFSCIFQPMLDPVIHKMIKYVQNVEEKDLKDKVMFYKYLRRIYCVSWKCW